MLLSWHRSYRGDAISGMLLYPTGKDVMKVVVTYSPGSFSAATAAVPGWRVDQMVQLNRPQGGNCRPRSHAPGSPIFTESSILSKMATGVSGAIRKALAQGPAIRRLAPWRKPFCSAENPTMRRLTANKTNKITPAGVVCRRRR
jgi:hypothetical protein